MARTPRTANADPLIESPDTAPPEMDYEAHVKTYNRFMHLLRWVVIHLLILMVGLYFMVIEGNAGAGFGFLAIAVAALVFGMMRVPDIAEDAESLAESASAPQPH